MSYWSFVLIGVASFVFIIVVRLFTEDKKENSEKSLYRKKYSVMNQSEAAFFFELKKQLPEGYNIFPKMRIADMLDTLNGRDYYRMRNKILPKHVDFLVCDKNFKPVVAIEINGKYHNRLEMIERDSLVNQIFRDAQLPLETINVGNSFNESISRLQHYFV